MNTLDRVTTGIPTLDRILGGGLPRNSLNILAGLPGTGKTVLAQQFVFANARPESRAIYLATLSEPQDKLVHYLQQFGFYDEDKLFGDPPPIRYLDMALEIRERGFDALPALMTEVLKEHQPSFVVIDSFKALRDLAPPSPKLRETLFDLATLLGAYSCTTLLIGEYSQAEIDSLPEFAVVDGIIHVVNQKHGVRDERYIRVVKMRGSSYQSGEHAFRIANSGLDVYPRLVTPSHTENYTPVDERVSAGVRALDEMLDGGLLKGSCTLLVGPAGSGKSILGLHFLLDGARRGKPGLLVSFQEPPPIVARTAAALGSDIGALLKEGRFVHLYVSPVELNIDDIMGRVIRTIEEHGIQRIVIDSLGDIEASSWDKDRFRSYIYAMIQFFAVRNITSMVVFESPIESLAGRISQANISYISDNVIVLRYEGEEEVRRSVAVLKSRGSGHDARVRSFAIEKSGITIGGR